MLALLLLFAIACSCIPGNSTLTAGEFATCSAKLYLVLSVADGNATVLSVANDFAAIALTVLPTSSLQPAVWPLTQELSGTQIISALLRNKNLEEILPSNIGQLLFELLCTQTNNFADFSDTSKQQVAAGGRLIGGYIFFHYGRHALAIFLQRAKQADRQFLSKLWLGIGDWK